MTKTLDYSGVARSAMASRAMHRDEAKRLREINAELLAALKVLYEIHVGVCRSAEIDPEGAADIYERAIARAEGDDR